MHKNDATPFDSAFFFALFESSASARFCNKTARTTNTQYLNVKNKM